MSGDALDPIETAFKTGAAAALRRRADRQAKRAESGTGEGAIAARVAATLLDRRGNEIAVRSSVRAICSEAAEECGNPAIDSNRTVNAVLRS
jgi:hypothetical protein